MDERTDRGQQAMVAVDGAAARNVREAKKLTQLYVATVVGVTTDTISRWENNRYPNIKKENAEKLAEALGVPLEEILRREEPPADEPAPEAPGSSRRLLIAVSLFLVLLAAGFGTVLLRKPRVTATRFLPPNAAPGEVIPVRITVTRPEGSSEGIIVKEQLPHGWRVEKASPATAGDERGEEVKWLIPASPGQTVLLYTVRIPAEAAGEAAFSGSVSFGSAESPRTRKTSGGKKTQLGPFHWSDANGDFRVDDAEIMPAYYLTEEMKELGLDWETVESIWSGKGYRWNAATRKYEVLR